MKSTNDLNCVLKWNFSIQVFDEKDKNIKLLNICLGVGFPLILKLIGFVGIFVSRLEDLCTLFPRNFRRI